MPKKGFKTITVNKMVYFKLMQWFQNSDAMYQETFPKFVGRNLMQSYLEKVRLRRFASQIEIVPEFVLVPYGFLSIYDWSL
jgi:predicted transglutaminase-like protease